jgi:subtilisin family serine protease
MSPTPRTSCAIPLLSIFVSLGAGACLTPDEQAKLDEDSSPLAAPVITEAAGKRQAPSRAFVAGELLVETDQKLAAYRAIELGGVTIMPVEHLWYGAWRIVLPAAANVHAAVDAGRSVDDVALAAAEQVTLDAIDAIAQAAGVREVYVNGYLEYSAEPSLSADPLYVYQRWHYQAVRLPAAWDYGGGSSAVRLAIIDSETDDNNHPDLAPKWSNSFAFPSSQQIYHHGAHVAGIAGGAINNGFGVGVCWNCRLVPLRMNRSYTQIGQAIRRAAGTASAPVEAEVINLSLNVEGGASCGDSNTLGTPIRTAIRDAIARGVTVVISAGNFGATGPAFPANCPDVISVAAIQPSGPVTVPAPTPPDAPPSAGAIATYSNRGAGITLAAPGGGGHNLTQYGSFLPQMPCPTPHDFPDLPSGQDGGIDPFSGTLGVVAPFARYADPITPDNAPSSTDGHCYRFLSGTSMAAPHVTGTVGLMKSRNPGLLPAQVKDILVRTAQIGTLCPPGPCGAGLLNAHAATRYATDAGVPVASYTVPTFGSVLVGSQVPGNVVVNNTGSALFSAAVSAPMQILGGNGQIEFAYPSGVCASGTSCPVSFGVGPSSSQNIPVRCRPTSAGAINATLRVPTNRFDSSSGAVDAQLDIALSCTGLAVPPDVSVTPLSMSFEGVPVNTPSFRSLTVRNDGGGTLPVTVSSSSADYVLTCLSNCACPNATCTTSLAANQTASFRVTFTPPAEGPRNGTISVATPADLDEPSTLVSLTGRGTIGALEVRPHPLHAGSVQVGNVGSAYGTFYNPGSGPVTISQISLTGSSANVFSFTCSGHPCALPITVPVRTHRSIEVHCTPTRNELYVVGLRINSDVPGGVTNAVVDCQGRAPQIAVTPSNGVSFGTVAAGATTAAPVAINDVNAGLGTTLSWSASVSSGTYQLSCLSTSSCSCAGGICTGNGGASLQLAFSPVADGSFPATLTVLSNDPDRPAVTRPISGTGQRWLFRQKPTTPNVEIPSGGTITLEISNQGPTAVTVQQLRIFNLGSPGDAGYFSFSRTGNNVIAPGATITWAMGCNSLVTRMATFEIQSDAPGAAGLFHVPLRCSPGSVNEEPPGLPPNPPPQDQ